MEGVAALKLKGNLYFLSSVNTQSIKHILGMNRICSSQNLDERLSLTTFVSGTTFVSRMMFNLKQYISIKIPITVIF